MEPKKLFENQRHIRSIKLPTDKEHPYSFFNIAARRQARTTLSGVAFKLYDYFTTYSPTYHEYLGKKNINQQTGLSKNSYLRAFKELEQYGYIQQDPLSESPDDYIFVESGATAGRNNNATKSTVGEASEQQEFITILNNNIYTQSDEEDDDPWA